jgi:N6-L-threonylcarbamoyladenine synthase
MIILGIETSCDETAAAVIDANKIKKDSKNASVFEVKVLSNIISSQIEIHKQYGGVVPEVAAREHVPQILPVIDEALASAGIKRENAAKDIDAIAVTTGPGLVTSLIIGVETAKTLAFAWKVPVIGINHIEGHIYANFIERQEKINFPAIILTVSGGHTILALMEKHGSIKTIGETRDDAAGEAFDKAAQLMGIGYPGGPLIYSHSLAHDEKKLATIDKLPRPMLKSNDFDFSFSGLKTALRYALENDKNWKKKIPEYAFEFQNAVIESLIIKTIKAAKKYQAKSVMLSGGVSANLVLREQLDKSVKNDLTATDFFMPDLKYTTDNAAMVATAGFFRFLKSKKSAWKNLQTNCNRQL